MLLFIRHDSTMYQVAVVLATISLMNGAPSIADNHDAEMNSSEVGALHRLLRVFGMNSPGRRMQHQRPPQYMLDLYDAIADSSGTGHTAHPYHANIVRSFPDKDIGHQHLFFFDITSSVPPNERVLEAEFHLYKMSRRNFLQENVNDAFSHLLEIKVYQVMGANTTYSEVGNKLLDVRRISTHSNGWEVFYVKPAITDWLNNSDQNHGLLVTVETITGEPADYMLSKFAKRHHHHISKQPILVIFTDDGRSKKQHTNGSRSYGYPKLQQEFKVINYELKSNENVEPSVTGLLNRTKSRSQRATHKNKSTAGISYGCIRHELQVDFEKIGWSSWIISPKWYNAYFCKGECSFPLGQNQWPTNHATVQSIIHELKLSSEVGMPCCVPSKLYSINLLYFDEHENVILKQYDDMVAGSCGCH